MKAEKKKIQASKEYALEYLFKIGVLNRRKYNLE